MVDGILESLQGVPDFDVRGWFVGVEQGPEESVLQLGVEDRDADALGGEDVGVAAGKAGDEPVEPQAAEVVTHLALAVVLAEVSGDEPAEALVGETGDRGKDVAQGAGQGYCSCVPEAQGPVLWPSRL